MVNEEIRRSMTHNFDKSPPRRLLVVRHGERCDFTFNKKGVNWIRRAFDANGKYQQFDLNLPRNLPYRKDGYENFASDSPLTEMGYLQSKIVGRALHDHDVNIDYIYCSSALRCVQTAVGIIKGLDNHSLQVNVEPGLFEWTQWCRNGIPSWIHPNDLKGLRYPVNTSYIPLVRVEDFKLKESLDEYYNRSYGLIQRILNNHPHGTILIVAHAASLDTLTRQLCGGLPRGKNEFMDYVTQIPHLGCNHVVEDYSTKQWQIVSSPIPPLTHAGNTSPNANKTVATANAQMVTMNGGENGFEN